MTLQPNCLVTLLPGVVIPMELWCAAVFLGVSCGWVLLHVADPGAPDDHVALRWARPLGDGRYAYAGCLCHGTPMAVWTWQ